MTNHRNSKIIIRIAAILCTVVLFFTSSCSVVLKPHSSSNSSSDGNSSTTSGNGNSSGKEEETLYNIGDTISIDDWEITVNSVEVTDKISNKTYGAIETYFSPDEGNKYVVFNMTVKNISTDSSTFLPYVSLDGIRVKIEYGNYEFSASNLMGYDDDLHSTSLNPLSTATGIVAFDIVEDVVKNNLDDLKLVIYTKSERCLFRMAEEQNEIET